MSDENRPGSDPVTEQYEAYPYPARDPADEAARLIEGSPSHPVEIDHMLFGGRRDWSRPFRALVAGGGTGDGLIMLAQKLSDIECPAKITYLDLSRASRSVAEARAASRGLTSIRFLTGDLTGAPALGPFDYIDCCGVLHHMPDPDTGFSALAGALAPGGGIGLMVYAPHGRSGVYPLQEAFRSLLADAPPAERLRLCRATLEQLGENHPFARNRLLGDHRDSDAGLYDMLLHSRDRPYTAPALVATLERAGLRLVSMAEPARYDPIRYLAAEFTERVAGLDPVERLGLAENLAGTMKTHVAYAVAADNPARMTRAGPEAVAHLCGIEPRALAAQVERRGRVTIHAEGKRFDVAVPRAAARAIGRIDGRRPLDAIAKGIGLDWIAFAVHWAPVETGLTGFGLMHYSRGARR